MINKSILAIVFVFVSVTLVAQKREYFQIKVIKAENESQLLKTENYLKYSYLPALKRAGQKNIGVFKEIEAKEFRIWVLLSFKKLESIQDLEDKLASDNLFLASKEASAVYNQPAFSRIESTILRAFADMPKLVPSPLTTKREDRIYELRSYESPSEKIYRNKVEMFNKGGEVSLFNELGFNAVFYGEVISGATMPNLMYMTTFKNQESRDAHWKAFGESPVWAKLKNRPEYQNNVSKIEKYFLYPTEYSDY